MAPISRSSSSEIGDYMGMENGCSDMEDINELMLSTKKGADTSNEIVPREQKSLLLSSNRKGKEAAAKEFPPPIPLLARTQNLASHMPWVLKRCYKPDGRLVLYKEKVRRHEYFKVRRENGRLILQLVPMDNDYITEFPLDAAADECDEIWEDNVGDQDDPEEDEEEVAEEIEKDADADDVNSLDDKVSLLEV